MSYPASLRVRGRNQALGLVTQYATHLAVLLGLVFVLFRHRLLSEPFFYDGDRIQQLALGRAFGYGDASYLNVAEVYRVLGLAEQPLIASIAGYALFVVAVLIAVRDSRDSSALQVLVVPVAILIGAVYLGYYSKDAFVLPITLLVLVAGRHVLADVAIVGAMLLYAGGFRIYWFIVAAMFVGYRIVLPRIGSVRALLVVTAAALVAAALAVYLVLGVSPDHFRVEINSVRIGESDASTMIRPFVALPDPVGGVLNVVLTFLALVVPVPLAALGGAYYLAGAALILVLWAGAFMSAREAIRAGLGGTESDRRFVRSLALVLAFLVTQALFEPDYGSALRHLAPVLPALIHVVCRHRAGARDDAPLAAPAPRAGGVLR